MSANSRTTPVAKDVAPKALVDVTSARTLESACEAVWVAGMQTPWCTLAVVPAGTGVRSAPVAQALAELGSGYFGREIPFVDARGLEVKDSRALLEQVQAASKAGSLVLALDDPLSEQAALLLARAVDRVVVAVPLGNTWLGPLRRLVEEVGKERFLGAVSVGKA